MKGLTGTAEHHTRALDLRSWPLWLTEGSVYERLRRHREIAFDAEIAHAALVYHREAREILERTHREYLDIGARHRIPMLALTDTWRASAERIDRSVFRGRRVNADNAAFLLALCEASPGIVRVGGNLGPRGDAYRPEQAPDETEAERLHAPQVEELASAGVDFLQASTLPALGEALGIARAMARARTPYLLSFVLRPTGRLLDGTPLPRAIAVIDSAGDPPPLGYLVNCVHPAVLTEALETVSIASDRMLGLQANTSRLAPEALDGRKELDTEEPERFARHMSALHRRFGLRILGGCCGTDPLHIEALARATARGAPTAASSQTALPKETVLGEAGSRREENDGRET